MIDNEQMRVVFALRAELARVTAERDALRAIVEEFNAARRALSKVHPALRIAPWGRAALTRLEQAEAALRAWPGVEVPRG